jgi:hypothetical protein
MMALAVLALGITGIFAMHKVTAMTNLHSKSVATATRIAQAWQNQLLAEGTLWRRTNSSGINASAIVWLKKASEATPAWFRPDWTAARGFGAAFDALGNPVADANIAQAQFCVHLLLVPVVPLTDTTNAVVRATIRVIWPRTQGNPGTTHFCSTGASVTTVGDDTSNFHSLYQTVAIRVHP